MEASLAGKGERRSTKMSKGPKEGNPMRQIALFLSLLLLASFADLSAQEVLLAPGARVRVSVPTFNPTTRLRGQARWVGTLVTLSADTLVLKPKDQSAPLAIPLASVTRLDVSRGRVSCTGRGILTGSLASLALGLGLLASASPEDIGDAPPAAGLIFLAVFTVPGAVIGGIVGSKVGGERWEPVPLDRIRVSILPQRGGGVRLAAAFTF